MNDMTKPPASGQVLFEIPAPKSEKVRTRNFGTVTMTAASPPAIEKIIGNADRNKEPDLYYRALVAECATGEKGERFTVSLLAKIPGNCYVDWLDLRAAAIRVCGLNREDVGNT